MMPDLSEINSIANFEYLIVLTICILPTFLISFTKTFGYKNLWIKLFAITSASAIPFIIWDWYATYYNHWGFNRNYNLGVYFLNLPVEEYLFFICIPFSCLFTWYNINRYLVKKP